MKRIWVGIVKLHLLNSYIYGIALLTRLRAFILHLEAHSSIASLGNVCKSYHTIAKNNNLSIKISNDKFVGSSSHDLVLDVLVNSFRRGHNFEIIEVQKSTSNNHKYIVAPTPLEANKIQNLQVSTHHQIQGEQVKKSPSLTLEQKAKK